MPKKPAKSPRADHRHAAHDHPATHRELLQQAASFAARAHEHQKRKDGLTPYVAHPFRVAITVRHIFGCEDPVALAAAMLHDTIEDCKVDYDDIEDRFGRAVADAVAALTKNTTLREDRREPEYEARLAAADWRVRLVKLADVYDNLSETSEERPGERPRAVGRARTAIALAEPDAARHPETARAISAVRELLAEFDRR